MRARRQRGTTTVELALVSSAFFLFLIGALEISRYLYTWNTLDRISQRAARLAAVCPPNHADIARVAGFGSSGGDPAILPDFSTANLELTYLDEAFNDTGGALSSEFVRARIVDYTISLRIPFVNLIGITSPTFTAVVPAESLGYIPNAARSCFGS